LPCPKGRERKGKAREDQGRRADEKALCYGVVSKDIGTFYIANRRKKNRGFQIQMFSIAFDSVQVVKRFENLKLLSKPLKPDPDINEKNCFSTIT
jgi:hypothetical protein